MNCWQRQTRPGRGLKDTFSLSVLANPIEASKGDGEMETGAMGRG
ncbi:Ferrous iron transport protein B [Kluyvera cryocrescens]|uniref:Ferrous iron transport protein B n=1 Tax=Kluyvera cryocrescens TaxID=580 RepID=A0A485ADN6_KLUCR|nr:Ferrous iron transport protein B [Kluyvera cryocrescens]